MNGLSVKYSPEMIREKMSSLYADKRLQLVILFGSFVSGKTHRLSDIDLAFLFDKPADILNLTAQIIRLLNTDRVDVVDLRRGSPLVQFKAVREGKLLYEREPGLFASFSSLAFRRYVDTKKMRDARKILIQEFCRERASG
jgi:predicted nucleotidyltransferase